MVLIGCWGAMHPWVRITGGRGGAGDGYREGRVSRWRLWVQADGGIKSWPSDLGERVLLVQGDDSEQLDAVQKEGVRRMRAVWGFLSGAGVQCQHCGSCWGLRWRSEAGRDGWYIGVMTICRLGVISLMQRTKCVEVVNVEDRSNEGAGSEVHRPHQSITEGIWRSFRVERMTQLLWAVKVKGRAGEGVAGPRTAVMRQGLCSRWKRMREKLGHWVNKLAYAVEGASSWESRGYRETQGKAPFQEGTLSI